MRLGGIPKIPINRVGDVENPGGNLCLVVEKTQESNGNEHIVIT